MSIRGNVQVMIDGFLQGELYGAEVGTVMVDDEHAAVEWTVEFTPRDDASTKQRQMAL